MNPLHRALLTFEALWWMTRIHLSNINMWPAVMGGVAAQDALGAPQIVGLVVFTAAAGGALFIVNDILDAEGDAVTAPYLPLPSGLVTKKQAWYATGAYFAVGVVALYLACGDPGSFAIAAGLTAVTVVLSMAYSKVKDEGVVASFVISIPQTVPAVIAWMLAGGGRPWALALVVVYHLTACVSNNVLAALRDVDLDPLVGNRTLPVRLGAARAFRLAAVVAYLALVPVLVLAVTVDGGWRGLPVAAVALALMAGSHRRTLATFHEEGRGRIQRMADMKMFKTGEYVRHMAVVACLSLPAALITGALLYLMLWGGGKLYARRMIKGGIRRSLGIAEPARKTSPA
ncbi:UbiA family prenyltransferase [Actinocorallia sp. B10E7]|uniref:UbiA family prenyltransferase n=1 Tax=Actinocorallia sp. B10E7 TaxID=3153558 RepID=UPI00325EAA60